MFHNSLYTFSRTSRLFVLGSIILLGLAMSSCASSDDPTSQGVGTENISSNTNTGVALNHINANVLQTSVQGFTRGAVQEDTATPDNTPTASDGGLTCDVTWGAPGTTRASDTGYTYQFSEIGSAIGSASRIAIQPRNYAADNYTYNVSTTGTISATTPYYFETANNDVITSWYPYSANLSSFTVQTDQSTLSKYIASDLLYTSVVVPTATHSLTYSHKMAQIIVDVTVSNATYLTNSTIQSLTISNLQTMCTPNFTTSGNTISAPSFAASSTAATVTAYRKSSTSTTAEFFLCVPAQTITSSNIFTVTVGGTAYTGKLTNSQTLSSGSAYNISITIDGKATMVYPSGNTIAFGDFYAIAANGQGVVIKNSSSYVSAAKTKGITPIAMVFHTSPSTSDKSSASHDAWTHGYAMSLKRANNACWWSTTTSTIQTNQYGAGNITNLTAEIDRAKANLDGYSETKRILAKTSNSPSLNYPACYYAVTYGVTYPKSSSGWYLPSVGQIFYLFYNTNTSTTYSLISATTGSTTRIGISYANGNTRISVITNKLKALNASDYTWGDMLHIWLSSEVSSTNALIFYAGTANPPGLWYIYPHYTKNAGSQSGVRPFIAF